MEAPSNSAGIVSSGYFQELLTYSAERLSKEPELLSADQERIRRQVVDTAVGKYQTFLHAAETIHAIHEDIQHVESCIEALEKELPDLSKRCSDLLAAGKDVFSRKEQTRSLLGAHATVLEVLELPQVMETCVRNGNYDEALDLEAFVLKLSTVLGDVPIVKVIQNECQAVTEFAKEQLLRRLSGAIQLPECLKAVGYLRRLGSFSEAELRRQFLACRARWIQEALDELDDSNAYEHLRRLTDVFRLNVFDVVMQYRAVFSDDTHGHGSHGHSASTPRHGGWEPSPVGSWAQGMMEGYLGGLREGLPRVKDGASLSALLEQCMSCGMSLGRIGLDIRPLLPPLFEARVMAHVASELASAPDVFRMSLDAHRWLALPGGGPAGGGLPDDPSDLSPPSMLMELAPLAVLLNRVLAALNELRHLAPLQLRDAVFGAIASAVEQAAEHTRQYHSSRALSPVEINGFAAFCDAFVSVLAPFLTRCAAAVYPGSAGPDLREAVGPVKELLKIEDIQAVIRRRLLARQTASQKALGSSASLNEREASSPRVSGPTIGATVAAPPAPPPAAPPVPAAPAIAAVSASTAAANPAEDVPVLATPSASAAPDLGSAPQEGSAQ